MVRNNIFIDKAVENIVSRKVSQLLIYCILFCKATRQQLQNCSVVIVYRVFSNDLVPIQNGIHIKTRKNSTVHVSKHAFLLASCHCHCVCPLNMSIFSSINLKLCINLLYYLNQDTTANNNTFSAISNFGIGIAVTVFQEHMKIPKMVVF